MKKNEVEFFIKIQSQMEELYSEISILSKKSQNDALNEFKLQFVNILLEEANKLLSDKYKPFKNFEVFSNEKIPTNSDVVMVLSQYLACLENMRVDNIKVILGDWYWITDNKEVSIKTSKPQKLS
jgi:hypothetical protein